VGRAALVLGLAVLLAGCGGGESGGEGEVASSAAAGDQTSGDEQVSDQGAAPPAAEALPMPDDVLVSDPEQNAARNVYFGDLHVHTTYSFDAFAFGTLAKPADAYRFAKGEAIRHPAGFEMQLDEPLDFYAVTDHAMFMGVSRVAADPESEVYRLGGFDYMANLNAPEKLVAGGTTERSKGFSSFLGDTINAITEGRLSVEQVHDITRNAWSDSVDAANEAYVPGEFTTFPAYEYTTSSDDRGNLHRNVFFKDGAELPAVPFSRFHSQNPEDLWDWMDDLREQGIEAMAIPHNSNGSNGQMFKLVDWAGNPLNDRYAEQRMRNEPLVEITQIKGTSETHPALSDNDEWAGFEIMPYRVATTLPSQPSGSYVREALINGVRLNDQGVKNPFKFGFIGSSDSHIASTPVEESDFDGKIGLLDATPELTGSVPLAEEDAQQSLENAPDSVKQIDGEVYRTGGPITWGASGLAAVWAEENTRESIYEAFRRRETFATTGPRIRVRFFAGYEFDQSMLDDPKAVERAYREGVTMGSDLLPDGDEDAPRIFAWAIRDAGSAPLQRLQVIKGWTVDDENHEKVFDVACADGLDVDPETYRCPDNGASVDLDDCSISRDVGASELKTVWKDPEFDPDHRAFYYVRVLENPTCRWSTWDAVRNGAEPRPDFPATIQERAYTSPVWYRPADGA